MTEKFYCVGCKEHYQLAVTEAVKKPSKGDSFRHSVVSYCPKGHKTTKICNKADYDKHSSSKAAESPLTSGPSPAAGPAEITPTGPSESPLERIDAGVPSDFEGEDSYCVCASKPETGCKCSTDCEFCSCNHTKEARSFEAIEIRDGKAIPAAHKKEIQEISAKIDAALSAGDFDKAEKLMDSFKKFEPESFEATQVVGASSPGAGINAALEPLQGGLENGDEPSLVPADSFQPNGNGHVIGQETDSYNTTPMHAEDDDDDFEPYFELSVVSNGTIGDIVGDYEDNESEKAFKEWEAHVNDDGPHVLIYYDTAGADGMIVAGDDFMDVWEAESESTGSRKAIMATAAAALVIGLVWYRSSRNQ